MLPREPHRDVALPAQRPARPSRINVPQNEKRQPRRQPARGASQKHEDGTIPSVGTVRLLLTMPGVPGRRLATALPRATAAWEKCEHARRLPARHPQVEGYAPAAALAAGPPRPDFKVPLDHRGRSALWGWAAARTASRSDGFDLVVSLYPWEKYADPGVDDPRRGRALRLSSKVPARGAARRHRRRRTSSLAERRASAGPLARTRPEPPPGLITALSRCSAPATSAPAAAIAHLRERRHRESCW